MKTNNYLTPTEIAEDRARLDAARACVKARMFAAALLILSHTHTADREGWRDRAAQAKHMPSPYTTELITFYIGRVEGYVAKAEEMYHVAVGLIVITVAVLVVMSIVGVILCL